MESAILPEATKPFEELPSEPEDARVDSIDEAEAPLVRRTKGTHGAVSAPETPPRTASRSEGADALEPESGSRSFPQDLEPTPEELQISARLLLHIAQQPRFEPMDTVPETLTQAGMAKALGASQSSVSNALNRLVDGGALLVQRSHVREHWQRLKIYQLTSHGESLVQQIRASMGLRR